MSLRRPRAAATPPRGEAREIVDPSWVGRRVELRLVDGSRLEGRLTRTSRFELELDGRLVVLKHAVATVEAAEEGR